MYRPPIFVFATLTAWLGAGVAPHTATVLSGFTPIPSKQGAALTATNLAAGPGRGGATGQTVDDKPSTHPNPAAAAPSGATSKDESATFRTTGDRTSTDALIADLTRVTKLALEDPQDVVSYEHIKRLLSTLKDRGIDEAHARALAAGVAPPTPARRLEDSAIVPTLFEEQLQPVTSRSNVRSRPQD